jgi:hypothetical protein
MFTKEHYIAVAKVLKKTVGFRASSEVSGVCSRIVMDFVELFRENPKFDKEKFLDEIYGKEKGR